MVKHLTAEVKSEEFMPGKGVVVNGPALRRQNHFSDALYYASAAGWYCNVRLPDEKPPVKRRMVPLGQMGQQALRPDDGPWMDNERWNEQREKTGR